jgi:hypothetical protein
MTKGFACPNPACTHVFPAAAVAGASVLTCPRCGTVFQFQSGAPAVASGTPSQPPARPRSSRAPTLATPVVPPRGHASPPPGMDLGDVDLLSPASIRRRTARPSRGLWKAALVLLVLVAAGAGAVYLAVHWQGTAPQKKAHLTGNEVVFKGMNFRYLVPDQGWRFDDQTKQKLRNAQLVLYQPAAPAWFAILARDFRVRSPRPRELQAEGLHILERYFNENLESEYDDKATILGRAAQRIVFRGQAQGQTYVGECHMFGEQGLGYWVLSWAAGDGFKKLEPEFAELRRRFTLADERKTWEEKRPAQREFAAVKAGCRLRDTESLWEQAVQPAADFDPSADLVLHATEQDLSAEGDVRKNPRIAATVMVLVLPKIDGDLKAAVESARAYLLSRQKMDYPDTTLEPFSDTERPPEKAVAIGNARGHLTIMRVRNGETRHLLVVQAVVPGPEQTLVIQGECEWKKRSLWEEPLLQLINSLQASGNAKAS